MIDKPIRRKNHFQFLIAFLVFILTGFSVEGQNSLPRFHVSKCDTQSAGYYFFSPLKYFNGGSSYQYSDVILDHLGNIVYYRQYEPDFEAGGLKLHSNGFYSYYFNKSYYVLDSLFNPIDTVSCQNGIQQERADLQILPNGHYALLGYETVRMDLSNYFFFKKNGTQGLSDAMVQAGVIQEIDKNKKVHFEWHSKNHFKFDDIDTAHVDKLYDIDWTHFTNLEYEKDGNYLVVSENFNEITKVNRNTGQIIWRLGGKRNQFAFLNDSLKFVGPHDVRRLPNRNITFMDAGTNRGTFHPETAKEYRIDDKAMTITLIWSHINNATQFGSKYGSVQRLPNKNTLVNYGYHPESEVLFNVVTPSGRRVFEIVSSDSIQNFRAYNYMKLPGRLPRPVITSHITNGQTILDAGEHSSYLWSTGETTRTIVVKKYSSYYVFVPFAQGFISSTRFESEGPVRQKLKAEKK